MRPTLLAIATTLALGSPLAARAEAPRLTLYSGDFDAVAQSAPMPGGPGFARYESTLSYDLAAGESRQSLAGLPLALDPGSVLLRPRGDASVRSQRLDFAVAGQDELLRRALGQVVTVEQSVGDARQTYTGTLLATGNGLTLKLADGRIKVLSGYASFELPALPEGVVNEPTLTWTLAAPRAGRQAFDLAYDTAGLGWRAEYQAQVSGQGSACRLELEGAAMVANRSGVDYRGVALTLVAGQPNRIAGGYAAPKYARAEMADMAVAAAPPAPQAQAAGESQAYRIPGTSDLPDASLQRLPLVDAARGITCERRYEIGSDAGGWTPSQPIIDRNFNGDGGQRPVGVRLAFQNRGTGLGIPLPAGRLRVSEGGALLGEAMTGHTPAGGKVDVALGTAFDLTAERSRTAFELDRAGRTMTETVEFTVRNAKAEAATVRIHENLPRWSDWELTASSVPAVRKDAQSASFDLAVPAGGEARLVYTVRYRWAPDVPVN